MIKVNNKKAVQNLADKSFRANKTRNLFAITAIVLTTVLFTTLFTLGIGSIESLQKATMRQAGGDGHAAIKYITDEDYEKIKGHPLIKEISYNRMLCDSIENAEFLKRRAELWYMDDVGMRLGFCEPTTGHKPAAENEIITDTKTLSLLGVPQELGAPVTLILSIRGQEVMRRFVLSGWWESDPAFNVGMIVTSRVYVDAHTDELQNTYKQDASCTGAINACIMFRNSFNLEGKLSTVLTERGYSPDENASNYLNSNVNWAYLSTNLRMDAGTIFALLAGILLIIFTGYLIIYNIFQISIIKDIRFYGLLKTIGTTGKQIRGIIRRQAFFLSLAGTPAGLLIGFFVGKSFVPLIINQSNFTGSVVAVSPSPWIFIGSASFAFATVIISTYKPGRMASEVSPVDAVRYSEGSLKHTAGQKKSINGGKMPYMAFSNLGRNKKRTVLAVISLSLSLVLLNTVFTLSQSIDMDKYLSKFVDTDFLIAHADYFRNDFYGPDNETTESIIAAVEAQTGFEEGGRLYGGRKEMFTAEDKRNTAQQYNVDSMGNFFAAVYGLENLPLSRLKLIDGELDFEKLATGRYILEGVPLDDNSVPQMDKTHYAVGDTVTLHCYKGTSESFKDRDYTTHEFTILGHVAIKMYSNSDRTAWDYTFYLPADVYKTLVSQPAVMSYAFNVSADYEAGAESFLQSYTDTVEPMMNYTSKFTSRNAFSGMRGTIVTVGGALSFIIGLVGTLNFINAILTGIITRRKEFAMLQGIGMLRKQLRRMLCCEGLYYAFVTGVLSLVFGAALSILVVKALCGQLWFMSYHFILWPLLAVLPSLFILGIVIPLVSYAAADRQSIVERLREAE
jgi:putative ABC transport system permease protein